MADEQARLGHDGQADILSDGVVSAAEYDSAFQELRRCLEAAGFEVTAPLISPVNGFTYEYVADFGDREMSGALKDLDSCEASHFSSVARAFSLSNIPEMESSLARAVFDCLERKGLDTRGDEANLRQFVESVGEEAALSCTLESAQVLFPDYPSLTVGY